MPQRWEYGDVVVRQELLGLLPEDVVGEQPANGVWLEVPVFVVADTSDHLVSFLAPGAPLRFPDGDWPTPDGRHPWAGRRQWDGHGCLMVQVPGEHHAVWHFWDGPARQFRHWYLNLQTSFVRTPTGYATQDLELDLIVAPDESVTVKDDELLEQRIADGRYHAELVDWIRRYGGAMTDRLDSRGPWWDRSWAGWTAPAEWRNPRFPDQAASR